MAGKAVAITLICATAAFLPLLSLADSLLVGSLEATCIVAAVMDLILSIGIMGGFIISAIEKNTAAKAGRTQDSANVTK